ncbi:MAG: globin family protein [Rhodobacteraceae bacterium]|nr:MAG: globin family protein [Paracoccaceae bacterium]
MGISKFDITRADIEQVVATFYKRIRAHPTLGAVFAQSIPNTRAAWAPHEAKIANFWANAILSERSYSGNPMQVHMAASHVHAEHFPLWLDLFETTLRDTLPPDQAEPFTALARRIGSGLQMGLIARRQDPALPPILT